MNQYESGAVYILKKQEPVKDIDLNKLEDEICKLTYRQKHKYKFPKIKLEQFWKENGYWSFRIPSKITEGDWQLAVIFISPNELDEYYEFLNKPISEIKENKFNRLQNILED